MLISNGGGSQPNVELAAHHFASSDRPENSPLFCPISAPLDMPIAEDVLIEFAHAREHGSLNIG
jgi:hypothetical protein